MCVLPGFSPSLTLSGGRRRGRRSKRKGGLLLREERCGSVCAFILLFVFCAVLFLDPAAQKKRKKTCACRGRLSAQCPLLHLEVSQAATPAAPQCVCVSAVAVTNVCICVCVAELESDCILLDKGKRPIRALLQRQARGFPWLRPPSQGVHVLQQAQNTLFPRIVFADFIAHS